ncbi:uncharacterized protein SCODWIG_03910 [Saccharomycodes ludwigii]|uniref:Required for respiratory growth protein 7, mitochondrial n=1 Tax=Saccharomycodes ludwigii TaxID=36035 RepID=A0A376BBS8_9ASCO|nr:hypothetical protein SCDLUD_000798 [Saccharomycodes ludwigii]KAH3903182.1 hypothetical protein SCDLUD_000798 [Saccharomycodes ludwigii]SSD62148.1 uncharacterized protein SCODWIG_03910 [Saccharomycodes ludwigii]
MTRFQSKYIQLIKNYIKSSNGIKRGSTVFQGTLYEYTVMNEVSQLFDNKISDLLKIGGSYDHGIDIVGKYLQKNTLLIQCKCFQKQKLTGKEIREFMGAVSMFKELNSIKNNDNQQVLSLIASPNLITKDGILVMNKLPIPMVYLQISKLKVDTFATQGIKPMTGKIIAMYENDCSLKTYKISALHKMP